MTDMEKLRIFRLLKQRKNHYEDMIDVADKYSENEGSEKRRAMLEQGVHEIEWIMERIVEDDYELEDDVKSYQPSDFRADLVSAEQDASEGAGEQGQ